MKRHLFRVTDAAIGFFEENANPGERFRLPSHSVWVKMNSEREYRQHTKESNLKSCAYTQACMPEKAGKENIWK